MSQFQFRMQSVLRLRERERDAAAESFRQARMAIDKLEGEIDELLEEHRSQTSLQSSVSLGVVDTQRMLESQRYQLQLLTEVEELRGKIALIEQELERRRHLLVQREQGVRVLEKLKENQLAQWSEQQMLRQQDILDQWAGFRYWQSQEAPET